MTYVVNVKKKECINEIHQQEIKKVVTCSIFMDSKKKIAIRDIYYLKNNKSTIMTKSILYLIGR